MITKFTLALTFVFCTFIAFSQQVPVFQYGGRLAGTGADYGEFIATDASGNIYVAGRFGAGFDADPGTGSSVLTPTGTNDAYLAKYDPSGSLIWVNQYTATSENITGLEFDNAGDLFLLGNYSGTISIGGQTTAASHTALAGTDAFIAKYDQNGNLIFSFSLGGPNTDYIDCIAFDAANDYYIGGSFSSTTIDLDPGAGGFIANNANPTGFSYDPYVAKFNNGGFFQWAQTFPGQSSDYIKAISIDSQNRVVVGGWFNTSLQCDAAGTFFLNATSIDCFIARFSTTGVFENAWSFGGNGTDNLVSIGVLNNRILCTGTFNNTADMAPGTDTAFVTSNGGTDVFLSSLNDDGTLNWTGSIGGSGGDNVNRIELNSAGEIFLSGSFVDSADFNLSAIRTMISAIGDRDGFLAKYDSSGNYAWAHKMGSVTIDYTRGTAFSPSGEIWTTGYYANNNVYLNPQSNLFTFTNLGSNDAYIVRFGECVYPVITTQPVIAGACNGGDISFVITASGQNITYQWQEGTNGGITWTNINNGGPYSGATSASLMISGVTPAFNNRFYRCIVSADCGLSTTSGVGILFVSSVDTTVNYSNYTLIAANNLNSTYQWLDCNNGYAPINGATGPSFTPSAIGNYAVRISNSICTDTSSCFNITSVGLSDLNASDILIYPVPARDELVVEMNDPADYAAAIWDMSGRKLSQDISFSTKTALVTASFEAGYYLLVISKNGGRPLPVRFVKQ